MRKYDRGASPVVSIVLLVAIALVMAGVFGAFALGVVNDASEDVPAASFETVREDVDFSGASYNIVFVKHDYGDAIDPDNLQVTVNGKQAWDVAGTDDSDRRTVKPTTQVGTLKSGSKLRLVFWPNDYTNFPVAKGNLVRKYSGGCGDVLKPAGASDCTLNDDIVGRDKSATIRLIYESPKTAETLTLDTLEVPAE